MQNLKIENSLAEYREKYGLTVSALAFRLGVSPDTVRDIEKGRQTPSFQLIDELIALFRCQPTDLFRYVPVPGAKLTPEEQALIDGWN